MKTSFKSIFVVFSIIFASIFAFVALAYFVILPNFIQSNYALKSISNIAKKQFDLELIIQNPKLKTSIKPQISFDVDKLSLSKKEKIIFDIEKFGFEVDFKNILKKEISIKKLCFEKALIKADELLLILPEQEKNNSKSFDYKIKFLDSKIVFKEIDFSYVQDKTKLSALIKDVELRENFFVFKSDLKISKNNNNLIKINANSEKEIAILPDKIQINDFNVSINDSKLVLNSQIDNKNILLNAKSKKFYLADIFKIINSNLIIPNGDIMLSPLNSPKGNVSFDIDLNNFDLSGLINVNQTGIKIKDVSNLPIKITNGKIKIFKDKILFDNLLGYYGETNTNKIAINGDIKDYYKTFDSNIEVESKITNEFFVKYLAPLINKTELYVSKPSRTKIIYKSKNNIIDLIWFAQIDKGVDFGITKEKSALSNYDRAVLGEFQIKENKIDIKNINYYISSNIVRGVKLQPILQAKALMDFEGKISHAGFAFGREMPCEFLNVFLGQKLFKKGTIKGKIDVAFKNEIPYLNADMEIKKTLIPTQRMFIKEAKIKADDSLIFLTTSGKFKRAGFDFNGKIKNGLKPPFVIKNLALEIDNLDIERVLASFNNQNKANDIVVESENDVVDDDYMFDTNLIRIEDCNFKLKNGNYKELTFGNIDADLVLNEDGILKIKSNKFDIAQGISTLKVECDLNKLKYYIRLGVKGIDSNLMAKTLFNLDKEITGLANGLIELNGDRSLKMNGDIKFSINNGTIGKIGLVEYLMKVASVFRNPVVMVSPATIMDIISIPEGKFDRIAGNIKIKDNVLAPIDIKSYSKSLSALIKGKFDLERHDASIRIYTRFSTDKKSMFGILRNISLNALANKVKGNSNDENYYASELSQLPQIEVEQEKTQVFLTQVEGDIEHFNFLSSLKKIK